MSLPDAISPRRTGEPGSRVSAHAARHAIVAPDDVLRIVRGTPDDVELAALVAGIVAAAAAGVAVTPPEVAEMSAWSDHARRLGVPVAVGPDAWRWSLRS